MISRSRCAACLCCLALALDAGAVTRSVPGDFATVQAAIDAAEPGDVVEVDVGTYTENLVLDVDDSEIEVRGVEAARTFLVAQDPSLPVVTGAGVNDLLFANFTFKDSNEGFRLIDSLDITMASNIFDGLNGVAIFVGTRSRVEIINNVFHRNSIAIDRFTTAAPVTNNIFSENTFTIVSRFDFPVDPNTSVEYSCFWRNNDLSTGGADTGLGTNFQLGNPDFVDIASQDFHLQQTSPCVDAGTGNDVIDETVADIGAYGGDYADARPFPVSQPGATDASTTNPETFNIDLEWEANLAYLVTNDLSAGGYRVWYQLNQSGPPYDGADATGGTEPSPIEAGDVTSYRLADLNPDAATPGVPVLKSASPQNESVLLDWSGVSGATSYLVYYGDTAVTDNTIDVGAVSSYTVTGLSNGTEYEFGVSATIQPVYYLAVTAVDSTPEQNESDYSTERSIALGAPTEGVLSNTLTAIPEEVVPYPDLPDEGCFVATAAFGADWVAEVQVLRDFRDRYLLRSGAGRAFVDWYYREGPLAAAFIERHSQFKPLVRTLLWPLVAMSAFMLGASAIEVLISLLLVAVLLFVIGRSICIRCSAKVTAP